MRKRSRRRSTDLQTSFENLCPASTPLRVRKPISRLTSGLSFQHWKSSCFLYTFFNNYNYSELSSVAPNDYQCCSCCALMQLIVCSKRSQSTTINLPISPNNSHECIFGGAGLNWSNYRKNRLVKEIKNSNVGSFSSGDQCLDKDELIY